MEMSFQWSKHLDYSGALKVTHSNLKPHFRSSRIQEEELLSVVSTLYDPLGFLAAFTITAKLLLQELCRRNLGWDDAVQYDFSKQWTGWLEDLKRMSEFKVNRCIKPKDFCPVTAQLHHFSDASQVGYGTVSYLRFQKDHQLPLIFLLGRARVAPLKQTIIPRLELTAAVLAVHIDQLLCCKESVHHQRSYTSGSVEVCGH